MAKFDDISIPDQGDGPWSSPRRQRRSLAAAFAERDETPDGHFGLTVAAAAPGSWRGPGSPPAAAPALSPAPGGRLPAGYTRARADVAQLARASACHAEGRGFESHHPL